MIDLIARNERFSSFFFGIGICRFLGMDGLLTIEWGCCTNKGQG